MNIKDCLDKLVCVYDTLVDKDIDVHEQNCGIHGGLECDCETIQDDLLFVIREIEESLK